MVRLSCEEREDWLSDHRADRSYQCTLLLRRYTALALQLASRAYVLEVGSIVLEGEAQKLLSDEGLKEVYLGF
jgi:ABC-type branched-subunit amino acid transport system ATPase component